MFSLKMNPPATNTKKNTRIRNERMPKKTMTMFLIMNPNNKDPPTEWNCGLCGKTLLPHIVAQTLVMPGPTTHLSL